MSISKKGRIWTIVMLIIILVLPAIALLLMKKGFDTRRDAPASARLIQQNLQHIPSYTTVSFRGDTITDDRMHGKVTVLSFIRYACLPGTDSLMRKLYNIQDDYYGKTLSLRLITNTLDPVKDTEHEMQLISERHAGRETWHFVVGRDSSGVRLFDWCAAQTEKMYKVAEPNRECPQLVYLIDSDGNFRGAYDPLKEQEFHDLYNDILFLINKLDLHE